MKCACLQCGQTFNGRSSSVFCSRSCQGASRKGVPLSAKQRTRISQGNLGKKRPPRTLEHLAKIGAALKGRKLPPEQIEKIRQRHLGRKRPIEWCQAISAGLRGSGNPMWKPDRKEKACKDKFAKIQRNLLNRVLRVYAKKKEGRTFQECGYSALQLAEHLESLFQPGMT